MTSSTARFRDPRHTQYDFTHLIVVRCPGCAQAAQVVPVPGAPAHGARVPFQARRLVCRGCGLSRAREGGWAWLDGSTTGPATDPYFGLPLWLRVETRHGWLWAYNLEHLDLIRRFVQASLRERAPWYDIGTGMTLVARLPVWIKRAKNRDEVLRAVGRIHSSLLTA